jgi:hypothetical protein
MVAAAMVFVCCNKDNGNDDDNGNISIDDIDVYVVKLLDHSSGECYSGDCHDVVNVLKNGEVLYTFPVDAHTYGYDYSEIAVSGNDVYVSIGDREKATIWKNGKLLYTFPETFVSCLTVSGNDVYAAGMYGDMNRIGKVWKNGEVLYTFILEQIYNMVVSGNDVYVTGPAYARDEGNRELAAIYWKNGVAYRLASPAIAQDIAVSGNDIYVTGTIPSPPHSLDLYNSATPRKHVYWKNGVINPLPCSEVTPYNSIEIIGKDVYTLCQREGALYKNGQLIYKVPSNPYNAPIASSIKVIGATPFVTWRLSGYGNWPTDTMYLNDEILFEHWDGEQYTFAVRSR